MTLLALETSCDETSAAVVRDGRVLANVVSSQIKLHAEYGGVVPELAAREHLKNLMPVAQAALQEAGVTPAELDAVAATQGPGLAIALLVGFKAAQAVAFALDKPFVGINHHEAHLYSPWITGRVHPMSTDVRRCPPMPVTGPDQPKAPDAPPGNSGGVQSDTSGDLSKNISHILEKTSEQDAEISTAEASSLLHTGYGCEIDFRATFGATPEGTEPAVGGTKTLEGGAKFQEDFGKFQKNISLIVSGGHTMLVLVESELNHRVLGGTIDDAAGECFDKTGKLMGLPYPAGPEIDRRAALGNPAAYGFPRPLLHDPNDDFSFSGLKTSIRYFIRDNPDLLQDEKKVNDLCASVQAAIVEVLVKKTIRAAKREGVRCVTASGGVTCNSGLRRELESACKRNGLNLRLAEKSLCTDNAAMIGILAERKLRAGVPLAALDEEIKPGWVLA